MTDKIYVPSWAIVFPFDKKTEKFSSYIDITPNCVDSSKSSEYDIYFNTYDECADYCNKQEVRGQVKSFLDWKEQLNKFSSIYKDLYGNDPNINYSMPKIVKC